MTNINNRIHQFDNGLVLLAEEMPWCESISFSFMLPAGVIQDPTDTPGLASLVAEHIFRGAGDLNNQEFLQTLENLGVETSDGVSQSYSTYSASLVADKIAPTLNRYADLILRPRFDAAELDTAKQTILQEFLSLEDEPSRKLFIELKRIFFPDPWNRFIYGTPKGIEHASLNDIKSFHDHFYRPNGAILGIAGRVDWDSIRFQIEKLFSSWTPKERPEISEKTESIFQSHLQADSTQTHLGLGWPSVPFDDPDYILAVSAVSVLSGGMTGRLFTEVREKRGLCYSVSCSHYTQHKRGAIFCFCGTRTNRAQESLDVILEEIDKIYRHGITERELELMKTRTLCALVMQQESTSGRADTIVYDWHRFNRIRSFQEIKDRLNALTCAQINDYLKAHPAGPMRLVTLGPEQLKIDSALLG